MAVLYLLLSAALCLLLEVKGHTYHLGGCPRVEPLPDFDMNRFMGKWYVIQKTSTSVRCLMNEYSAPTGDRARLVQSFMLGLPGIRHVVKYTGELTTPNPSQPAAMDVKFPLSVAGKASYTVFTSDYDNFAAVYTCQKLALWFRHSVSILSRQSTLDSAIITQIHSQLKQHRVDPEDLDNIRQDCPAPTEDGLHLDIRPNVFKPTNVTQVLSDASDAVSGVADVAKTVLDVYNTVTSVTGGLGDGRRRRSVSFSPQEFAMDWIP